MTTLIPPLDPQRLTIEAPITEVTLLEDRASVLREGAVTLPAAAGPGRHRLVLPSASPVMQDVSLRVELLDAPAGVSVADVRCRRALRARREEQPEAVQAIAAEIRELEAALALARDGQQRVTDRHQAIGMMLARGAAELPQDVAWGLGSPDQWEAAFGTLFERARELRAEALQHHLTQQDRADDLRAARRRQQELRRREHDTVAWVEIDLVAEGAHEGVSARLSISYTAANALWRPLHRAELRGEALRFTTMAAVWQQTGEDWSGVQIVCSTARASLGIEPPMLSDDLLKAKRKAEQVRLQAREVAVQQTGPGGDDAPPPPAGVELPGVDDGGEVQHLRAMRPADVPSDGRLVTAPLFTFEAPAKVEHVLMAESEEQVHLKSTQRNTGSAPVLAGPVELIRDSGAVGWGEVLFVSPGAAFELGFGRRTSSASAATSTSVRRSTRSTSGPTGM